MDKEKQNPHKDNDDNYKNSGPKCTGENEYFQEYCNNTSLHGLKYVGGENRTLFEKVLWLILFSISVACCTLLITKTYIKWQNTPVLVNFAQTPTPTSAIPFPAITICPQSKVKQSIFNFTEQFFNYHRKNITKSDIETLDKLKIICDPLDWEDEDEEDEKNERLQDALQKINLALDKQFDPDKIGKVIFELAPTVEDVVSSCVWNSKKINCEEIFQPILTEDGLCFTFNLLDYEDLYREKTYHYEFLPNVTNGDHGWDLEHGYKKESHYELSYPRRTIGSGMRHGLDLYLKENGTEFDYFCQQGINGYKVMVHQPGVVPRAKTHYIRVPIDQALNVAVEPEFLTTSDNLRSYKSEDRYCYFNNEKKLKFFKTYSQENCELECLTNYTLKKCNCVAYFMPRNETTEVCGYLSSQCVKRIERSILEESMSTGVEANCHCMPACFSLEYSTEISQAAFHWEQYIRRMRSLNEIKADSDETKLNFDWDMFSDMHLTKLRIFFKEDQFISTDRDELYGVTDFLANCGGIFGLFTGFSILSLLEIIYYLTVRSFINKHVLGRFCVATPESF